MQSSHSSNNGKQSRSKKRKKFHRRTITTTERSQTMQQIRVNSRRMKNRKLLIPSTVVWIKVEWIIVHTGQLRSGRRGTNNNLKGLPSLLSKGRKGVCSPWCKWNRHTTSNNSSSYQRHKRKACMTPRKIVSSTISTPRSLRMRNNLNRTLTNKKGR